ncbi:MAG: hypothetical protein SFX73_15720 [Kofleriaceae bacterium]|nr:hypothetical protein [Kofleriaceae bacterium]
MHRLLTTALPLALALGGVLSLPFLVGETHAELDQQKQIFASRTDGVRVVVPRGWLPTDQTSYPGLLLWLTRNQPPGQIVLTGEALTRQMYCSWPIACRTSPEPLQGKYACAIREKLNAQRMRVGPTQQGPKDNDAAGVPSVWFEYDDGKRFLRHAIAVRNDRAISLVLSAPSNDARATHARSFEQVLRTLRPLTAAESAAPGAVATDGVGPLDAPPADGATQLTLPPDGGVFESSPPPAISAVGSCP